MAGEIYLSKEGFEKLRAQLERLKGKERIRIATAIHEARMLGDISENADYDAAKEAQAHNEAKIAELESKLAVARIIDQQDIPTDQIFIGAKVTIVDLETDEVVQYTLVSAEEANYEEGKISIHSPVGKALMGKKIGDKISINVPAGVLQYKVEKIER